MGNWDVEFTDEFGAWWVDLTDADQDEVSAVAELLMEHGPDLPFPYSSGVEGSRHSHMRELLTERRPATADLLCFRSATGGHPAHRRR